MDTEAWRFLLKNNEIIYFYMFNSIIGYKVVTYKTEIHSCELEHLNLLSKCWFALHISLSLILPWYSNFDSRMETGEFNSHHLLQDFVKWESLVHVLHIMNHFRKKKYHFDLFLNPIW